MKAKTCPASQRRAERTDFGIDIWNLLESLAVSFAAITISPSIVDW
jgi:hypothetical protein